jgi:hypothetical protein
VEVSFFGGERRAHGENHRPVASHSQTLSHNVISSTHRLSGIRTHNDSGVTLEDFTSYIKKKMRGGGGYTVPR